MRTRIIAVIACGCLLSLDAMAETFEIDHPNVVFLLADDLGWTALNCFGSDLYETPNLDRLAADGMKFTNAYAACTVCSPTRASVMTGMYPARLRCTDFIAGQNRPFAKLRIPDWTQQLESRHVTIAEALKKSGYRTAQIGKWHLNGKGAGAKRTDAKSQGFDISISRPRGTKGYYLINETLSKQGTNYLTDWLTDKACEFIGDETQTGPFFLYFAYNVPHTPIQGREDLVEYFAGKVDKNATHKNPIYAAMVKSLDESVGRILAAIEKRGLTENTVIIFTSDNGGLTQRNGKHDGFTENLPLRRGKGSAYEGGVRVPTIIHWPGVTSPDTVCEEPIMTIDYYPTLLEMLGINGDAKHNQSIDGQSIQRLLENPAATIDRSLYWHYPHYHAGGDGPYSAVRTGNYRLIEFHEDKTVRLYDLANDIGEQTDLAQAMPKKVDALRSQLHRWRLSVAAQMPTINPDYDPTREGNQKKPAAGKRGTGNDLLEHRRLERPEAGANPLGSLTESREPPVPAIVGQAVMRSITYRDCP